MIGSVAFLAVLSAVLPMTLNVMGHHVPVTLIGYHLSFLLLGCLIRQTLLRRNWAKPTAIFIALSIAITLPLVSGMITGQFTNFSLAMPIGAILSIAAAFAVFLLSWNAHFTEQPGIALKLGAWSYSIYLFHEAVATTVNWWLPPTSSLHAIAFVTIVSGVAIALAAMVYKLVEKPAIDPGRSLVTGKAPRASIEMAP